ncbi:hypothetical protein C8C84_1534 [Flavobacterium sp. 102]|nr:hypothetical protein C8C84_1534 [Flavobacterium sp. 102]
MYKLFPPLYLRCPDIEIDYQTPHKKNYKKNAFSNFKQMTDNQPTTAKKYKR